MVHTSGPGNGDPKSAAVFKLIEDSLAKVSLVEMLSVVHCVLSAGRSSCCEEGEGQLPVPSDSIRWKATRMVNRSEDWKWLYEERNWSATSVV